MNLEIIRQCLVFLGIRAKIVRASDLEVDGTGEQLVLNICKALDAEVYISGISGIAGRGKAFEKGFVEQGITVVYDEFYHPIYTQLHEPFIPCMSVVDVLFNYGEKSLDIINGIDVPVMAEVFP